MNWILWIYAISALASAVAAVLAWAAKLWWAKEYSAAKDETIKAKEAQIASLKAEIDSIQLLSGETAKAKDAQVEALKNEIQNLRELTPMKVREYFLSVKGQLEEYNDKLREELKTAYEELEKKDSEISRLISTYGAFMGGPTPTDSFERARAEVAVQGLEVEKEQLRLKADSLKQKLQKEEGWQQTLNNLLSWLNQTQVDEPYSKNELSKSGL